ncbi:MAG: chromate resistance protein [Nitrospinae bacterium]|nr:chromate resistance protein [Nitrospinota bacterium]
MKLSSKYSWLVLVISLPTENATPRMRIWRALKSLGCAALRDGVYLLPDRVETKNLFEKLAEETIQANGYARLLPVVHSKKKEADEFVALFDRSADYLELTSEMDRFKSSMAGLQVAELRRSLKTLRRNFEAISGIDYFPGPTREQTAKALERLDSEALALISPDEPRPVPGKIERLRREDYQGRVWATRQRPWIDRLASAWLIKRFIDPKARLIWLRKPSDCPAHAVGFDFDGAEFTHVGGQITFEVLLASFGLEEDRGLSRLAVLTHYLDVGGAPVPEASGLETMMSGAQLKFPGDDDFLAEAMRTLDLFYAAFSETRAEHGPKLRPAPPQNIPVDA